MKYEKLGQGGGLVGRAFLYVELENACGSVLPKAYQPAPRVICGC